MMSVRRAEMIIARRVKSVATTVALTVLVFVVGFGGMQIEASQEPPTQEPNRSKARELYEEGLRLESAGKVDKAISYLSAAIAVDPEMGPAYFSRSGLYADQGDYVAAVNDLTTQLKLEPKNFSLLFNRGLYNQYLKRWDASIADYSRAADPQTDFGNNVSSPEECRALALSYRGRVFQWYRQDYRRAVDDYTQALQLDPDIRMLYYRRGQSHHELGMYREADQDYEQSYERRPDYGNLIKSWAWQLSTCPDPAFRDGKKAIRLLTKEGRKGADLETLAAAYAEVGDFEEAVQLQQQLLKRYAGKASAEQLASHQQRLKLYQAKKPYRTSRPASND